jgi:hypothetical protein
MGPRDGGELLTASNEITDFERRNYYEIGIRAGNLNKEDYYLIDPTSLALIKLHQVTTYT